jgi:hypothetical protein
LTAEAGLTPALSACQPGGALELKISSERTLRKVFSTQTKRIVFVGRVDYSGPKSLPGKFLGLQVPGHSELVADDGPHVEQAKRFPVIGHEESPDAALRHHLDRF